MDRPALQRLLGDISAGNVDVVVVYKIDRLTRALPCAGSLDASFPSPWGAVSSRQRYDCLGAKSRLELRARESRDFGTGHLAEPLSRHAECAVELARHVLERDQCRQFHDAIVVEIGSQALHLLV